MSVSRNIRIEKIMIEGAAARQEPISDTSNNNGDGKIKAVPVVTEADREIGIVNSLTLEERRAVEITLKLLEEKKSRWITALFKYASAVSSEEIAQTLDGIERSFEVRGKAASEIWKDQKTKKKKYKSVDKLLPEFFKDWLHVFSERRKSLKTG